MAPQSTEHILSCDLMTHFGPSYDIAFVCLCRVYSISSVFDLQGCRNGGVGTGTEATPSSTVEPACQSSRDNA